MSPGEEWYLDTADGHCTLYVVERGEGPPVIVLHGGPGHSHGYMADAVASLESDYRVALYDQRGALLSPCDEGHISHQNNIEDLELLRREMAGDEAVRIVAHSAGTLLAMDYVGRHPQGALGLVLSGSLPIRYPTPDEFEAFAIPKTDDSAERFEQRAKEQLEVEGLEAEVLSARDRTRQWRIRFAAGNLYHVDRWRQLKGGRIYYNEAVGIATAKTFPQAKDYTEALKAFGGPVTFINGDQEHIRVNRAFWQATLARLPNAELVVLERAGHAAWIDQPSAFERELRRALAKR
ncbi:MAG: alpha/beta hydrolase [Gammaproteobacteria bacterium]|nr:alpha/beta hydrolase [Gammaproteobacteria bacterium]